MAQAYSVDLRERVLQAYDDGIPVEDIFVIYDVSRSWVYSLIQQRRDTGDIAPRKQRHGPTKKLAPYEQEVRQLVADHPDATLAEFCEKLSPIVSVSTATLCDYLKYLKITWKKKLSALPNSTVTMSPNSGVAGNGSERSLMRKSSFSSMKLGRKRT